MTEKSSYQLVFEGPVDASAETIRQLKGVFIAELNCSIEDVQRFLQKTPSVILATENREELMQALSLIEQAGGQASITGDEPTENEPPTENKAAEETCEEQDDAGDESGELEFTFDLEELEDAPAPQKPKEAKVYSLDFDPDDIKEEETAPITDLSTELSFDDDEDEASESPTLEVSPEESPSLDTGGLSFEDDSASPEPTPVEQNIPLEVSTPEAPAIDEDDDSDFDLNLSFDEKVDDNLTEEQAFDLNIAGEGKNWDLSLDGDKKPSSSPLSVEEESSEDADISAAVQSLADFADQPDVALEPKAAEPTVAPVEVSLSTEAATPKIQTEPTPKPALAPTPAPTPTPEATPQNTSTETIKPVTAESPEISKRVNMPLLLGVLALLVLVNGYFLWSNFLSSSNSNRGGLSPQTLDHMISSAAKRSKVAVATAVAPPVEEAPLAPEKLLEGTAKTSEGSASWTLIAVGNEIKSGEILFSANPPTPLTKLEIGRGKIPHPWLHKVELSSLKFSTDAAGNSVATASARMFVEQDQKRRRIIGFGKVITAYDDKEDLLAGTLMLTPKESQPSGESHFELTGSLTTGYTFSIETEWVAKGGARLVDPK